MMRRRVVAHFELLVTESWAGKVAPGPDPVQRMYDRDYPRVDYCQLHYLCLLTESLAQCIPFERFNFSKIRLNFGSFDNCKKVFS